MAKLPRAEAEFLAAELVEQLRPHIERVLVELLSEPDPDALSPRQLARVERAAAKISRRMEGLPAQRPSRRKAS